MKKKRLRIGFLAPEGTFSEEAAFERGRQIGGISIRICLPSFDALVRAVISRKVNEAVIPLENMIQGDVGEVFDSIIAANGKIKIKGELILPVKQNLIVMPLIRFLSEIKLVASKREATTQCQNWMKKHLPKASFISVDSTGTAVKNLHTYGRETAAIGSLFASKLYGRKVLAKNIQDKKNNTTHFLVLSGKDEKKISGKDKTSLIFIISNRPGSLYRVLGVFDALEINMTKIESRPSKNKIGEYIFWVDIDGHRREETVKEAIKALDKKTDFLKVLGSYPKYKL